MGGAYGPATAAQLGLGGVTVGSALGGLGLGFGAGTLLNGLVGGNQTGGMIGSGGGALAGAVIGSIIPGIGTVLGGLIGGAGGGLLGGMFGPRASNREGNATFDFASGETIIGGQTGGKFSQANRDAASQVAQQIASIVAQIAQSLGATPAGGQLRIGVGDRDGIFGRLDGRDIGRFGRDEAGFQALTDAALRALLPSLQGGMADQFRTAIAATNATTGAQVTEIATWIGTVFRPLAEIAEPVDAFTAQMQALNKTYDDAIARARELGLSEAALNEGRARQLQTLRDQRELEGLRLVASQQSTLTSFLDSLSYASAGPAEKLRLAQDGFGNALAAARSADLRTADLASVTRAASTLLDAGRGFYASGAGAADLERFVRSSIESLGAQLQLPAFGGDLALSLESAVTPLKGELELLRDEVAALREELCTTRLRSAA